MEHQKPQDPYAKYNSQSNQLSKIIFASRWLQLPIYLGLIVVQSIYAYKFMKSLWYLIANINEMDSNTIMLTVLNLIDVVMIANLLVMVTIGGYEIFVSKLKTRNHPDQPEWMSHVNATVLNVKSEAFHVDYHDFLNSHVANFRERQQFAGKNYNVAAIIASRFLGICHRIGLYRQNSVQHQS
jgi:TIGR00645 family protein